MNIQQLRYVVAIANSGTFREAAEKMYVSQPSLSIAVRGLFISTVKIPRGFCNGSIN